MKNTTYDDSELIELICDGTMSNREIARRLTVSASFVSRVSNGRSRPELLPRIARLARKNLRAARRRVAALDKALAAAKAARPDKARPVAPKHKDYDEDRLVKLLGEGWLTYKEIAQDVGLDPTTVGRIARGTSRPHLQRRIARVYKVHVRKTRGRGAYRLWKVLDAHMENSTGDTESARKGREFLLNKYLDMSCDEAPETPPDPPFKQFAKLTPETQARIAHDLGGPAPGPETAQDRPEGADA